MALLGANQYQAGFRVVVLVATDLLADWVRWKYTVVLLFIHVPTLAWTPLLHKRDYIIHQQ
jgi:hypothetical protein